MKRWFGLSIAVVVLASCAHRAGAPSGDVTSSQANIRGANLEYFVGGRGEPVLLIHGSILADAFLPILRNPALSRYQLITFHRRGFAGSDRATPPFSISDQAADAYALLRHLGIDQAHVVGHSYGAVIALQLTLEHPEAVASLSLLEPPIFNESPSAAKLFEEIGAAAGLHQKGDDRAAIDRFLISVGGPNFRAALDQNVGAAAFNTAVADAATFFEIEMPALEAWKFDLQSISALRAPVLLVVGRDSREAFLEAHASLRRRLPGAEEQTVPNATHVLQVVNPEPVAQGLAAFFKRHPLSTKR